MDCAQQLPPAANLNEHKGQLAICGKDPTEIVIYMLRSSAGLSSFILGVVHSFQHKHA
jgi:hypothetical protein